MIKRIVKLSFKPENILDFIQIFESSKPFIEKRKGCIGVSLHKDSKKDNLMFTVSIWESEDDLNAYRNSELFENTWAKTKVLFNDKPEAWSLEFLK